MSTTLDPTQQIVQYPMSHSRQLAPVIPLRAGTNTVHGEIVEASPEKRPGDELVVMARAAGIASRWSWRNRWQLSPAVAAVATMGAANAGNAASVTAWWATITAGVAWWAVKGPDTVGGRTWLSRRERMVGAAFGAGAACWSGLAALGAIEPASGLGWATLAAATGAQGLMWASSRAIRPQQVIVEGDVEPTEEIDADTLAAMQVLAESWPVLAAHGPRELNDSELDVIDSPKPGVITGQIILSPNVHASNAARAARGIVEYLERALELGIDTVRITTDRNRADMLMLTISPERTLERQPVLWDGPKITPDGRLTLATTEDGTPVEVALWAKDGARHMVIVGSTGSGKSTAALVILSAGVMVGREVLWHADGKRGTSVPKLARAVSWVTRDVAGWRAMIRAAHAVMVERETRYGNLGLDDFPHGRDPLLVVYIDEATTVGKQLTQAEITMLDEIAMRGRSTGVSLRLGVQRASADCLPGGIAVRENVTGAAGGLVGLRAGGSVGAMIATSCVGTDLKLTEFPPGPGWCAVVREGEVIAPQARTLHATEDALEPFLANLSLVELSDTDMAAAEAAVVRGVSKGQEVWDSRVSGPAWHAQILAAREAEGAGLDTGSDVPQGTYLPPVATTTGIPTPAPTPTTTAPTVTPPSPSPVLHLVQDDTAADDDQEADLAPVDESLAALIGRGVDAVQAGTVEVDKARILGMLRTHGQLTKAEVMEATGLKEATARRRLHALKKDGLAVVDAQHRWSALPQAASA